jgi:phospholipase D1/2
MQSLVYGSHSLVNRIRCALAAKQACKNHINQAQWDQALENAREGALTERPYEQIGPDQWAPYLTLLNLRNCEVVGGQLRTEQIYVHSKLLIADDSIVVMGSANINDRSLKGQRDSELAVYIQDKAIVKAPLNGKETEVMKFGHELRKALWRKHLGLTSGGNGVVKPASALAAMVDKPSAPETIKAIQALAAGNQAIYEKTFGFVPRSKQNGSTKVSASMWPVVKILLKSEGTRQLVEPIHVYENRMPFSDKFWEVGATVPKPSGIHGFFTALPIDWTKGENNHPDMNKLLLTHVVDPEGRQTVALSDATRQSGGQS